MAHGNRGFADLVASASASAGAKANANANANASGEAAPHPAPHPATRPATRLPPRTGILGARENRLAELAAGASLTRVQEFVDPARCRIWDGHNRDYAALTPENCADLIESFRAQGKQEVPAIVRRITGGAEHAYEVICGARRHWTVSWLRANNFPEFRLLVEPRELTDEEAFRLADLENRNRRDLSDYERATDYARAIERYYGGSQQRMVERLEVSKSWMSRYLELAKLPAGVVAAFGSPHAIGISHGALLAPLLRVADKQGRIIAQAGELAAEQAGLRERQLPALSAALVARRLAAAAQDVRAKRARPREHTVRGPDGAVIARGERAVRGGAVSLSLPAAASHQRSEVLAAIGEILDRIGASGG